MDSDLSKEGMPGGLERLFLLAQPYRADAEISYASTSHGCTFSTCNFTPRVGEIRRKLATMAVNLLLSSQLASAITTTMTHKVPK